LKGPHISRTGYADTASPPPQHGIPGQSRSLRKSFRAFLDRRRAAPRAPGSQGGPTGLGQRAPRGAQGPFGPMEGPWALRAHGWPMGPSEPQGPREPREAQGPHSKGHMYRFHPYVTQGTLSTYSQRVTGKTKNNARNSLDCVRERYPEVARNLSYFRFPGRGQRDTPVVDR